MTALHRGISASKSVPELGLRRPPLRDPDHRLRYIYPENAIAGLHEFSCPQYTPAAQVHHEALADPGSSKEVQYAGGGPEGVVAETDVVDVGEVLSVPLFYATPPAWGARLLLLAVGFADRRRCDGAAY